LELDRLPSRCQHAHHAYLTRSGYCHIAGQQRYVLRERAAWWTPPRANHALARPGAVDTATFTLRNTATASRTFTVLGEGFEATALSASGYVWLDTSTTAGGQNVFTTISGDDETAAATNLPFVFPFFGTTFSQARICSNGWLSFTDGATTFENQTLPATLAPRNLVAALWDDLIYDGNSRITRRAVDADTWAVSWENVKPYGGTALASFQAVLKRDGRILLNYRDLNFSGSYTIGVQDANGTRARLLAHNTAFLPTGNAINRAYLLTPGVAWASPTPSTLTLAPQETGTFGLALSAGALPVGNYTTQITLRSSDPAQPVFTLPVTMSVTTTAPLAPTALQALARSDTRGDISWQDNAANEHGYRVERRRVGETSWVDVSGSLAVDTTSYRDTGLIAGTNYEYQVRAFHAGASTASVNTATVATWTGFRAWLDGQGRSISLNPAADEDGDGAGALLEYALGGDLTVNDAVQILPSIAWVDARLALRFNRASATASYSVEGANEVLGPWTPIWNSRGTLGLAEVRDTIAPSALAPRRFLRLRVNE
jgi:Fibronectin type III domain